MIYTSFTLLVSLTQLWIGLVSCAVYHIVPSSDYHCPAEPCLTLSSFAANASLYLDNNTSLIFQPGSHILHSKLNVSRVNDFSMTSVSDHSRADITCVENSTNPGFTFYAVKHIYVRNLKFFECYHDYDVDDLDYGIMFTVTTSSLVLVKCMFEDSVGIGLIHAGNSNVTIVQSTFKNIRIRNNHETLKFTHCNTLIVSSAFINNDGPALLSMSKFGEVGSIREISRYSTSMNITDCEFRNNHRSNNDDHYLARIVEVFNSDVSLIHDTKFTSNKVDKILYARESAISTDNCEFQYNNASVMHLDSCTVDILNSIFNNNNNTNYNVPAIKLWNTTIYIHGSEFHKNEGGAIGSYTESLVIFRDTCTFTDNQAEQGGAIHLGLEGQCILEQGATVTIANNTASEDGGGIYLDYHSNITLHSRSTLQILENRAAERGGGIYASNFSSINLGFKSFNNDITNQASNSTIYFYRNRARNGGGLYLELLNSVIYAFPCLNNTIGFDTNSADYGGAVYVSSPVVTSGPECFFQSEVFPNPALNFNIDSDSMKCNEQVVKPIYFSSNRANYSGFSLYKRAFNYCSIGGRSFEEFELVGIMSNIQTPDIGSARVQVCYCEKELPECSRQIPYKSVKTEEKLVLYVATVDRGNHIVNSSIESEIRGTASVRDDQRIQDVRNGCTTLIFNIYSFEVSQQLVMSPRLEKNSIYISTAGSERSIQLKFLACISCPIGFQQIKDDAKGCDCVCDKKLELHVIHCNYTRETITKKSTTAWITYLSVKNASGYLMYPYCPMDYCLPPDIPTELNLNIPNGADIQCAHNRSGTLCGACSPGLSLSLGSLRCLQCHTYWSAVLAVIIFSSLLAGIILVGSLLMLNLTVAVGTFNGLIFYANTVAANQYKFFPATSFVTVFVSWLNLELGIDTCFFDGMDFYWKTWIQLAFPAYILVLVALVIVISEYSVKFAKIVGKRNPVATLDTLILLCYVKLLRTIIVAFSFATLDYPDGSHRIVWWPDATVGYFSGKHIVLWIVAIVIFHAGLFFTIILFLWQWLLYYQHRFIFKWIQSQRLRMFVEPYHAPYAFKHRYWTGLLLLVRVIVHVISAANVWGDRGITLLAIGVVAIILLFLVSCRPYKSWPVEVLAIASYANIAGLCLATFYTSKVGKSQDVVGYISGTIAFILFLIVLTYHIVTQLFFKMQFWRKLKNRFTRKLDDLENEEHNMHVSLVNTTQDSKEGKPAAATYSEVDPPPRREAVPPSWSYFVNLRSRRNTNDSTSGSANYEENELKPIERKMIDSSTPYSLMN